MIRNQFVESILLSESYNVYMYIKNRQTTYEPPRDKTNKMACAPSVSRIKRLFRKKWRVKCDEAFLFDVSIISDHFAWGRDIYTLLVHVFVRSSCVRYFLPFSLPLCVMSWLRLVFVALP